MAPLSVQFQSLSSVFMFLKTSVNCVNQQFKNNSKLRQSQHAVSLISLGKKATVLKSFCFVLFFLFIKLPDPRLYFEMDKVVSPFKAEKKNCYWCQGH